MKLKIKFTSLIAKQLYDARAKELDWNDGDSGLDVSYCDEHGRKCTIAPGGTAVIPSGLICKLSDSKTDLYEIQVRGRSSLNSKGILVHIGTVDYDYTGSIGVVVTNLGKSNFEMMPGDRIAQLVVAPIKKPEIVFTNTIEDTKRGVQGFGSTGNN